MKKYIAHGLVFISLSLILCVASGFVLPEIIHAQNTTPTSDNPGFWEKVLSSFAATLASVMLKLVSLLTSISGLLLNGVIYHTIVHMKDNLEKIGVIGETWQLVRDIANMGFIFVLLYAAIQMILGTGSNVQKLIKNIIIAALLVNFSMFFTEVIIDVANVISLTLYNSVAPGAATAEDYLAPGLSDSFMDLLKLGTLYQIGTTDSVTFFGIITIGIMGSILMLISSFVFFAVAILFIIRFVVLIMVLILSPIAFVAEALPGLNKYSKQWWEALTGQAFFAPIYFLLTWITLNILGGIMGSSVFGAATDAAAALNGTSTGREAGIIVVFLNFSIVTVFMIVSLVVAKSWASKVPGVGKLIGQATGLAGGATMGLAGRFGRGTVGRLGQVVADNETLKSKAPTSAMARLALATGKKTAGASFDIRGTAIGGSLDAGKARKGGFAADMKKEIDEEKKYADSFKPSDLVVAQAEDELNAAKKAGDSRRISDAQRKVDELKGASEEDMGKRRIEEIRKDSKWTKTEKQARKEVQEEEDLRRRQVQTLKDVQGMSHEEAEEEAEKMGVGWKATAVESVTSKRKKAYAGGRESGTTGIAFTDIKIPHFSITGRVAAVGPIKKERRAMANAIRKSIKDKKPAEKIAEEIEKQAKEAADGTDEPTTPSTGSTAAAGSPPTP